MVKVEINFEGNQRARLDQLIRNTWNRKEIVGNYLRNLEDELVVADLKEAVQRIYFELSSGNEENSAIRTVKLIDDLSIQLLPVEYRSNPSYEANAKAIVFHFFEFCDIGKKTPEEQGKQQSLF